MNDTESLSTKLKEMKELMSRDTPEEFLQQQELLETLRELGVGEQALEVGDTIPDFKLTDHTGSRVRSEDLLKLGFVVISFFRGQWCPFCQAELQAFRYVLPEIRARGARLVAISPQTVEKTMSTAEKLLLDYTILADLDNEVAHRFGLMFRIPEEFRDFHDGQVDLREYNGNMSYLLPIPATYVVDQKGIIRYAYVNVDFTERAEPSYVIETLEKLSGGFSS